jgi:Asp-tRNA(Asn)/Glu-tRNA(Gln) amidotransferase C subunit
MRRFGLFLLTILLGAALPVLAVPESAPDELEHNRRLLERYRADPEHYARLVQDLRAFKALPAIRQEKIRQFDRALHEEDSETQTRLWEVLERYVAWVERLPEADRKRLDDTTQPTEKLAVVRELRQQEWIDHLPKAERENLLAMTPPARANRAAVLHEEEGKNRLEWVDWANALKTRSNPGSRPKRPTHLSDFPESVQTFVTKSLSRMLSDEEKERLKSADGQKWPRLAKTILELSERHPVLPPLPSGPIERFNQLPKEVKEYLPNKKKVREELNKNQDKWPQYALAVADVMKQEKRALPPLGASRPAEFDESVQTFLKEKLEPVLTTDEKTKLHGVEGRWPEYPQRLMEFAHKNNLIVPGMSLPGPRELWNSAHAALPAVAQIKLEEFARNELTDEDRAKLAHAGNDLEEQLEMLKDLYFNKYHPEELIKLRGLDRRGPKAAKP